MKRYDVIVVGGGASGLFAAAHIAASGLSVLVVDPNRFLGRKLRITGKGRCNLTNNCSAEDVMKNVLRNPKFLYSALSKMPPEKIMSWFDNHGVQLKTERGRRVFPISDRANDVAEALVSACKESGVQFLQSKVTEILIKEGEVFGVKCSDKEFFADNVILACGGMSYPRTGSDGNGYNLAQKLGHTVVKPQPSLVPIETEESFCQELSGLTLKNVTLNLLDTSKPKKPIYSELGELTFMQYGIAGPLGLSASCLMDADKLQCKVYKLVIDLKPALSHEQLDLRIQRDIKVSPQMSVYELLCGLLPRDLAQVAADVINIDKAAHSGNLTREERLLIVSFLKQFELIPNALRTFDEAIITRGGISVKEIFPASMESKLVKDLYFTGEIIDCDAFTGGYNLTIAFATAYSAAVDIISKKEVGKWD